MPESTPSIERDISALEQQITEKRSGAPEQAPDEKEALHAIVQERIQSHANIPSDPNAQSNAGGVPISDDASGDASIAPQVERLVETAFSKGVDEAIRDAVKTKNPALIDAFHDMLVDELYGELVARKKLIRP